MASFNGQPAITYEHLQDTVSDTWVIEHKLNQYPAIDVFVDYDGHRQKIIPAAVEYTSSMVCTITFTQPFTGAATVA
jgi:hypothetical protein